MKKLSKVVYGVGAAISALPGVALAQFGGIRDINARPAGEVNILDTIIRIANWLFTIAFGLAVLFLVIGGVRYVISAGRENEIESAKQTIFNAIIGIIIILLSLVIVNTLARFVGGR